MQLRLSTPGTEAIACQERVIDVSLRSQSVAVSASGSAPVPSAGGTVSSLGGDFLPLRDGANAHQASATLVSARPLTHLGLTEAK
jgi:hypothetical protein